MTAPEAKLRLTDLRLARLGVAKLRRRIGSLVLVTALAGLTAACADPWVDSRREAGIPNGTVGSSTPDRVTVCHAGDPSPVVVQLATQECAKTNRSPVYVGTLRYQCRLDSPNRSYFDCK